MSCILTGEGKKVPQSAGTKGSLEVNLRAALPSGCGSADATLGDDGLFAVGREAFHHSDRSLYTAGDDVAGVDGPSPDQGSRMGQARPGAWQNGVASHLARFAIRGRVELAGARTT